MSEAYIHLVAGPILLCWGFEPGAYIHITALESSLAAVEVQFKITKQRSGLNWLKCLACTLHHSTNLNLSC